MSSLLVPLAPMLKESYVLELANIQGPQFEIVFLYSLIPRTRINIFSVYTGTFVCVHLEIYLMYIVYIYILYICVCMYTYDKTIQK